MILPTPQIARVNQTLTRNARHDREGIKMPHVIVKMYPGRSHEQKQALAQELTNTLMSVLGSKKESISVGIEDVASADWAELVNKPDVLSKPDTIFKHPGVA
jgi:4-oxalocrotonate tautomerase